MRSENAVCVVLAVCAVVGMWRSLGAMYFVFLGVVFIVSLSVLNRCRANNLQVFVRTVRGLLSAIQICISYNFVSFNA